MNSATILCALATVCCFSTGNAVDNSGTAALAGLKAEVEDATNDLSSYNKNLVDITRTKLTDSLIVEFGITFNITNSTLGAIQSEIEEATLAGKNADGCFEPARKRIRQASIKSQVALNRCSIDALATVYPVEKSIDALLQRGNLLAKELETIAIDCTSPDAVTTENCITAKIPEARSSVDAYRYNARSLKENGDKTSSDAQISAHECYQPGVQTLRELTNSVHSDAHRCVANAETVDNAGTVMLASLKSDIEQTTKYLSSDNEELYHSTQSKLSDLLVVEFNIVIDIINSTFNVILSEIDQARAAGKNAEHCLETSTQRIGQARLECTLEQYKCFSSAVATVDSVKESIDAVVQLGNRLTSELDAVVVNCTSSNATATDNCILAKIPEARSSVDTYLNTVDMATQNGDRTLLEAQVSAHECYQPGVQTLRNVTSGVRSDAHQCVVSA